MTAQEITGGMRIHCGWPCCLVYLVSLATTVDGVVRFVLVSDPDDHGSMLRTRVDGDYLWTEQQILALAERWAGTKFIPPQLRFPNER